MRVILEEYKEVDSAPTSAPEQTQTASDDESQYTATDLTVEDVLKDQTSTPDITKTDSPLMVDKGCQTDPPDTTTTPPVTATPDKDNDESLSDISEMEWDGDADDPDYDPDMDVDHSDASDIEPIDVLIQPKDENKYIVFESSLVELLSTCAVCFNPASVSRRYVRGTMVVMVARCTSNREHIRVWESQPSHRGMPVGNLLLAGGILFSGSSPVKAINVLDFMKVACFRLRTYYNIQSAYMYLLPAIDSIWEDEREQQLQMLTGPVKLGGDARCCSPGHTAKYCSYSLMNLETAKVMEMQLVQSNEVANSNAMELEGLKRCLGKLHDENVQVASLTTDRHPQVKKYMREQQSDITHYYDVWHVAKCICGPNIFFDAWNEILFQWTHSISNHIYYCAAPSGGNGDLLVEMWTSLLRHVVNIHDGHGILYPRCEHEELTDRDREWIKKESKPHKELRDVVERKMLIKDIQKLSPAEQTSSLESFHKTCCYFATKFVHFFYLSMEGRLKLACLHFNENSNRPQAVTKTGQPKWQVYTPKFKKGEAIAKPMKAAPTYTYVDRLMEEVLIRREEMPSYRESMADLQSMIALTPKPVSSKYGPINKELVIAAHRSRFTST